MDDQLIYRTGTANDLQGLKELGIAAYSQYATVLTPENWKTLNGFLHNEKALSELIAKATVIVCVHNTLLAGAAYLIPRGNPTDIFSAGWCYIRMLGVR